MFNQNQIIYGLIIIFIIISLIISIYVLINNKTGKGPIGPIGPIGPGPHPHGPPSPSPHPHGPPIPPSPSPSNLTECSKFANNFNLENFQNDIKTINNSNNRAILLYNNTKQDLYISFDGKDWTTKKPINPTEYSGFKLSPDNHKILELPQFVDSGRIWARTNCEIQKGYQGGYSADTPVLYCDTGNCPLPKNAYPASKEGVLCYDNNNDTIIGGLPPTTPIEFTFNDKNLDYYDISQVDGNNISVSMLPISASKPKTDPTIDDDFWCKTSQCSPYADKNTCLPELRNYNSKGDFVGCSSLCKNLSKLKDSLDGKWPNGEYSNTINYLEKYDNEGFEKLKEIKNQKYIWNPNFKSNTTDKYNRPWTKTGRWELTNGICSKEDENSGNCLDISTVVCCEGVCDNAGDIKLQGCSPYVNYTDKDKYEKHLCWSETWPKPDLDSCRKLNLFTEEEIKDGKCNYNSIFKKQCPKAYSWQFDDESSTYKCAGKNDLQNYLIVFCDKIVINRTK
jgi:hypothetical protein